MAARAIWRGTISFGMVSIPVKLLTATESQDISFRQLHAEDNSPIKLIRRCAADGQDLAPTEIVKGYEYSKDRYVIIDESDLEQLPVASKHTIELTAFVGSSEIDPIYFEKTYFLEPEEIGRKPFALLAKVLKERNFLAVGKISIRTKERLCALRMREDGIVLETLYYADEVREPDATPEVTVSAAEMKIANALIDLLEAKFDPTQYADEYRQAMMNVITAKLDGQEYVAAPAPEALAPAVDLMAALRASVEAAKKRKAGAEAAATPAESESAPATKPARRRKTATPA
ncbi:MAG: Ku protein [Tepidiformaceae bacterium]